MSSNSTSSETDILMSREETDGRNLKDQPSNGNRHRSTKRNILIRLLQVSLAVGFLLIWELLVRVGWVDSFFFPEPTAIASQIGEWLSSGFIYPHLWITLQEALYGFLVGAALGLVLGFILARHNFLAAVFDPFVKMFNALPRVVLAPIFLLWFGLGIWSKVAFAVTLVFFIVFFNTLQGVRNVDPVLINNAKMLGANERQLTRQVLLPSALTWIFSSLHTSVGFALVGAVVGEYLGASGGVGYVIAQAEGVFDTTSVFAGMIVLMIVVVFIDIGINYLENHLLRWQRTPNT